ncbi:MAG: hypothetical protein EHM72_20385, partial [Calditrichaeota bacterium]
MGLLYRLRWVALSFVGFAALFFTYIKLLDPQLVYMHQHPVFFFENRFLHEYISYPGGIVEYLNAFFMQWYFSSTLGALILCLVLLLNVIMIRALLKVISPVRSWTGSEFLMILPLALHQLRYDATLTPLLCSLIVLAGLYFTLSSTRTYGMIGLFALVNAAIYYIGAGTNLIYALLFLILMRPRSQTVRLTISLIFAAYTAALPYFYRLFTSTDPRNWYTALLPRSTSLSGDGLVLIFWLILIVFLLLGRFMRHPERRLENNKGERSALWGYVMFAGAVVSFIVLAPMLIDVRYRSVLRVNVAAEKRDWTSILAILQRHPVNHRLSNLQLYRALYFTQQLGDQLFSYENVEQQDGLYRNDRISYDYALEYCDLLLDLGNINGAQHRAYEAMAVEGESPRVLRRLVLIHLAKEEYHAAEKYLLRLLQTNRYKEWSRNLLVGCRARNCQDAVVRSLRTHRLG